MDRGASSSPVSVRAIAAAEHRQWIAAHDRGVSFLQTPEWAGVKAEWRAQSLGWFRDGALIGTGLVLYRPIPRLPWSLAYLPEGPSLPWADERDPVALLAPLVAHLKAQRAFTVKIGPTAVTRRWSAATVKAAIAEGKAARLGDVEPDAADDNAARLVASLRAAGWTRHEGADGGFGDVQPRYVFQLSLAERTLDDVFAGFNQEWRRNIRKAERSGVQVREGTADDLPDFHRVYVETAARDGFRPRGLPYFQRMWSAMREHDPGRLRLFLATKDDDVLAATTLVTVGRHAWYSYGASTTASRDLRPSNAVQWAMIRAAHESGCTVYDLRGIGDALASDDPLFGLIRFKLGTGGEAVEYAGEWDLPLNRVLHRAVNAYLRRRG
jgi:lipid II:glycine glycyltransferase (peptidoglycan interpeptide bridge formation enzyme)